VTDLLALRRKR